MNDKTLDKVKKLAKNKESAAAKKLNRVVEAHRQAAQKQAQISEYRQQYESQLERLGESGITSRSLKDYRQFLVSMDDAIDQQSMVVTQAELQLKETRSQWQQRYQQKTALEKLIDKRKTERTLHEDKREQRQLDELSSRR